MTLLLGASGYIGQAFARALEERGWPFASPARKEIDYTRFEPLLELLRATKPAFVINAAGYSGKPNVDACEKARAETFAGNTLLPQTIAHACAVTGTPWGHVSSGCIYTGAKLRRRGSIQIEKDLMHPEVRAFVEAQPDAVLGYAETDEPNFTFRQPPCSFYSGTKALGEEAILGLGQSYIWRLRIPFDEQDNPRNYLTKVQRYAKVYDNFNSISHRADFVNACLDLWEKRAPFGIYNITNPGFVSTRQVIGQIQSVLKPGRAFEFWASDEEFYRQAAQTPRSNCIMDPAKLQAAGVRMRPIQEALEAALRSWKPASG